MKKEIQKSQQVNIIKGNDDSYVIKSGKLIKVIQVLFPCGLHTFTGSIPIKYVLEDGEIIETLN